MNRNQVPFALFGLFCLIVIIYGYFLSQKPDIAVVRNTLPLELAWTYKFDRAIKLAPLSTSSIVVVLSKEGVITALDNQTGVLKWQYDTGVEINGISYSAPKWAIEEDRLILAPDKENLLALDAQTGKKIWETQLSVPTWNLPTISIQNGIITVGEWDTNTNAYLAEYSLQDGLFGWDIIINQPRSYRFLFKCPFISARGSRLENAVCVLLSNGEIFIIDASRQIEDKGSGLLSTGYPPVNTLDTPVFQDGFIFTNPSPNPAIHVLDTIQEKQFILPASCQKDRVAHPVTVYKRMVLVANGCDEIYTLDIQQLDKTPKWIFQSNEEIYSSFVTMNGDMGYFLNEKAEVIGIDLITGDYIGKLTLDIGGLLTKHSVNYLISRGNELYLVMNEYNLFTFTYQASD